MSHLSRALILDQYHLITEVWTPAPAKAWAVLCHATQTNHVVYQIGPFDHPDERRRVSEWVDAVARVRPSHLLPVQSYTLGQHRDAWVVTPYTGNQHALLRLPELVESRGGQLPAFEVERAVAQLLDALDAARHAGLTHGPLDAREVLVDRHGRLWVELFGLRRRLEGLRGSNAELRRDEVRSVVELAYRLLTGIDAAWPLISPGRLVRRLPKGWDAWCATGLDPSRGFEHAAAALAALPSLAAEPAEGADSGVLSVLTRLRAARRPAETTDA